MALTPKAYYSLKRNQYPLLVMPNSPKVLRVWKNIPHFYMSKYLE